MKQQCLLRLNVPPGLEDEVIDLLLASKEISGFQSYPLRGHGQVGAHHEQPAHVAHGGCGLRLGADHEAGGIAGEENR